MYFCKCYRQPFVIERWKNANIVATARLLRGEVQSATTWPKRCTTSQELDLFGHLFPGCADVPLTAFRPHQHGPAEPVT
jgi:hypothetical protein